MGKHHCTIDLLFDWFGISCMTTENICFYLQSRLIQTSQTGGQWYSDTSPFSIPCCKHHGQATETVALSLSTLDDVTQIACLWLIYIGKVCYQKH
jgi:hypothetical protein